MMNDLCADIGYKSINHHGEQLCGDHVDIVERGEDSVVVVLADGLGSGVKASILSTLTSKIISTMMAEGLSIEECVSTIAATLPVCSERDVAYSTFTIIHLINNRTAELIQYDNPEVIMIRDGAVCDYPKSMVNIGGKQIWRSTIQLREDDLFVAVSDGCPNAGPDNLYNPNWTRDDIASYVETISIAGYTANVLASMLVDECFSLYGGEPTDDATACVIRIRKREPMSILFGPPSAPDDASRMMSLFFSKQGKHIICGGTTASIAADWLGKVVEPVSTPNADPEIPPISRIDGVDLVTEGVVTMSKVLTYAEDYLGEKAAYEKWSMGKDGASLICRALFEEATDINFYVGRAMNPAHQNPQLPVSFNIKMNIVEKLSECLRTLGKRVKVSYF